MVVAVQDELRADARDHRLERRASVRLRPACAPPTCGGWWIIDDAEAVAVARRARASIASAASRCRRPSRPEATKGRVGIAEDRPTSAIGAAPAQIGEAPARARRRRA